MMKQGKQLTKQQRGFTLIESLLTLFVLTIGILGVAGMHMQGMRSSHVAMQRMAVTVKAQELMERIRANEANVASYNFDSGSSGVSDQGCNSGTICTGVAMATHDLFMWNADLNNLLPGAPVATVVPVAANAVGSIFNVTITVTWADRGDNHSYSVTSQVVL